MEYDFFLKSPLPYIYAARGKNMNTYDIYENMNTYDIHANMNMIVVTVLLLILNRTEFHLVKYERSKKN